MTPPTQACDSYSKTSAGEVTLMGTDNTHKPPSIPDPHFGTDDQMLAWCQEQGLEPIKDTEGNWDWHAVYQRSMALPEKDDESL